MALPNYSVDVGNPFQSLAQGYTLGAGIRDDQAKQQQQALALQQQQQMRQDFMKVSMSANSTPADYARLTLQYPAFKDQLKQANEMKTQDQRTNDVQYGTQVYAALTNGAPDIAKQLIERRITALKNSGDEKGAQQAAIWSQIIDQNPVLARNMIGTSLVAHDDKLAGSLAALGGEQRNEAKAPGELAKTNAEAGIKTVEAANAPTKTALDNQAAINKARIDDLNAQISQANSETQRGQLILERDKLTAAQAKAQTESGDIAQSQVDSAQHALSAVASLRADPLMKESAGNWAAGIGTVIGKLAGMVPGTENKDFRDQLESLKSQLFLPAVQQVKGMGSLSNAEGEKLTAAVAAINADMGPKAFNNALGVIERYLNKGMQKGLANKSIPVQGGGFVVNHPQFGAVKEGDINRLLKQFPGSTREQVLQYLSQTGGK